MNPFKRSILRRLLILQLFVLALFLIAQVSLTYYAAMRFDRGDSRVAGSAALILVNPDPSHEHGVDPGPLLAETGGR